MDVPIAAADLCLCDGKKPIACVRAEKARNQPKLVVPTDSCSGVYSAPLWPEKSQLPVELLMDVCFFDGGVRNIEILKSSKGTMDAELERCDSFFQPFDQC